MGIWSCQRLDGSIHCRGTTKEMRAQRLLNARQPAGVHRRVLAAGRLVVIQSSFISVIFISVCQSNKSFLFLVFSCQPAEIAR